MIPLTQLILCGCFFWLSGLAFGFGIGRKSSDKKPTERYFIVSCIIFRHDGNLIYSSMTITANIYPSLGNLFVYAKNAVKDAKSIHVNNIMELNKEDFVEFRKGQNTSN